MLSKDAKVVI